MGLSGKSNKLREHIWEKFCIWVTLSLFMCADIRPNSQKKYRTNSTCHMSCVTHPVSPVTCQMLPVICHLSPALHCQLSEHLTIHKKGYHFGQFSLAK